MSDTSKKWPCGCPKKFDEICHTHTFLDYGNRAPRCQVEHDHWEGRMICGNVLPCRTHGR